MQIWNAWLYTFLFTDCLITDVHLPNIYSVHSTHFWKRASNTEFISKLCFGLYKEAGVVFCVSRVTETPRPVEAAEYEINFVLKTFPHKIASTVLIQVSAAAWQLGNTGWRSWFWCTEVLPILSCFPGMWDTSGLPSFLLAVPGDVREHQKLPQIHSIP